MTYKADKSTSGDERCVVLCRPPDEESNEEEDVAANGEPSAAEEIRAVEIWRPPLTALAAVHFACKWRWSVPLGAGAMVPAWDPGGWPLRYTGDHASQPEVCRAFPTWSLNRDFRQPKTVWGISRG